MHGWGMGTMGWGMGFWWVIGIVVLIAFIWLLVRAASGSSAAGRDPAERILANVTPGERSTRMSSTEGSPICGADRPGGAPIFALRVGVGLGVAQRRSRTFAGNIVRL